MDKRRAAGRFGIIFQTVSLLIAIPALLKAVTGLLLPGHFYGWRRRQYASASVPRVVLVMPSLFVILAAASWYATVFHYQAWGWVVTAFTTLIGSLGMLNLSRWSSHRQKTGAAIDTQPGARIGVDLVILLLGVLFAYLAFFVF